MVTAQAMLVLSNLACGQVLVLSLAGLIGATSVVALRSSVLPRWIGRLGGTTAGVSVPLLKERIGG